ncbi:hypothetical protein Mal65_11120 [Crateriforma conspicua]|nr:hypothetical protein Mal65_11120 [Crateriforma conspicua]
MPGYNVVKLIWWKPKNDESPRNFEVLRNGSSEIG